MTQTLSIPMEAQLKQMTFHLGFEPPQAVPARNEWAPDTAADVCMSCERERFSMVRLGLAFTESYFDIHLHLHCHIYLSACFSQFL